MVYKRNFITFNSVESLFVLISYIKRITGGNLIVLFIFFKNSRDVLLSNLVIVSVMTKDMANPSLFVIPEAILLSSYRRWS